LLPGSGNGFGGVVDQLQKGWSFWWYLLLTAFFQVVFVAPATVLVVARYSGDYFLWRFVAPFCWC
jgi:hypothetical protein